MRTLKLMKKFKKASGYELLIKFNQKGAGTAYSKNDDNIFSFTSLLDLKIKLEQQIGMYKSGSGKMST